MTLRNQHKFQMLWSTTKQPCTLYSELGLGFDGAVVNAVEGHAGVESCVVLRKVGDLQAATRHHLAATPTVEKKMKKGRE